MADQSERRKTGKVLRWVLGGSLALNLIFVGLIAGAVLRNGAERGERFKPRDVAMVRGYATPYLMALPRDMRRQLTGALRAGQAGQMLDPRARRAAYAAMIETLRITPFDEEAVRQILVAQGQATVALQSAAQELWLAQIAQMSDAERADYAQRLEEVMARRVHRKKGPPKN